MRYRVIVGIGLLILLFIIFASCFSKPESLSLEAQNIDIVKLSFYAFEEGDWPALSYLYSPGYLQHSPDFKAPITWPEYELSCRIVHSCLPELKYRIVDIFAAQDKVAVRSVWDVPIGPNVSPHRFHGIARSGSAISIFRIEDGKIIEEWCEFDPAVIKMFCTIYKSANPKK